MPAIPTIFTLWLKHYGSVALFAMLALGIVGLPVPDEALMVAAGTLIRKGHLFLISSLIAAYAGTIFGITVSYLIGLTGRRYLMKKYGNKLSFTSKLETLHDWYKRYGKWTLFFGFFFPGIRHFTGLSAGMGKLNYKQFALFAYSGAIFFVSCFIAIGYFFSNYLLNIYHFMAPRFESLITVFILVGATCLLYKAVRNGNQNL